MTEIPIHRTRSGRATPHRPYPADTRIIADHGLHTISHVGSTREMEWCTVVGLWHQSARIAYELAWTTPASEPDETAEQPAVERLARWWRVLAGLTELGDVLRPLVGLQLEIDQAESLGEDRPVLLRERAEIETQAQVLREVLLARTRAIGDHRDDLAHITMDTAPVEQSAAQLLARAELASWRVHEAERDDMVRYALTALGRSEISALSGIGRATINRIDPPKPRA